MIWFALFLMVALAILFVWPALSQPARVNSRENLLRELTSSKTQLAQIKAEIETGYQDEESAGRARRAMERRILQLGDRLEALGGASAKRERPYLLKIGIPLVIAAGSVALYPFIGAPGYSRIEPALTRPEIPENLRNMSMPALITELEAKLAQMEKPDPVGYVLLARAKMNIRDFDGAIADYKTAVAASENHPDIMAEFEAARKSIAAQKEGQTSAAPDLNSDQADTIRSMPPEEQAAQINAMVTGLAARLEDNPDDLQGWLRLIRARSVLGETELAKGNLATAFTVFEGNPEALAALTQLEAELRLMD